MQITEKTAAHHEHVELARLYSSVKMMGPPLNEKLITIIAHLFTREEARLCRHLSFIYPKTAGHIARKSGLPADKITRMLDSLSQKRIILSPGNRYMLYPLIPGSFEHLLRIGGYSGWNNKYAELINDLFNTGYMGEYFGRPINALRNIPVQKAVENNSVVADSDLVSELIDSHRNFSVYNVCPCRKSMRLTGHACKRADPGDGCLTFGDYSLSIAEHGDGRSVSKEEMRGIVEERWGKKLVFLTSNVIPTVPTAICTCCDCCCHALGIHNKFSKNLLAPPHLIAAVDESRCVGCGRCVTVCNTYAHTVDNARHGYDHRNCIGCGNCVMVCGNKAITMIENRSYRPPVRSYQRLILKMLPPVILTGTKIKLMRFLKMG